MPSNETMLLKQTIDESSSSVESKSHVPMEIESSQVETQQCFAQPCSSRTMDKSSDLPEDDQSSNDDSPCSSMENKQEGHMMENLQDRLTKMRVGFLEKYERIILNELDSYFDRIFLFVYVLFTDTALNLL